jgi:hypothetical protein
MTAQPPSSAAPVAPAGFVAAAPTFDAAGAPTIGGRDPQPPRFDSSSLDARLRFVGHATSTGGQPEIQAGGRGGSSVTLGDLKRFRRIDSKMTARNSDRARWTTGEASRSVLAPSGRSRTPLAPPATRSEPTWRDMRYPATSGYDPAHTRGGSCGVNESIGSIPVSPSAYAPTRADGHPSTFGRSDHRAPLRDRSSASGRSSREYRSRALRECFGFITDGLLRHTPGREN